MGARRKTADQYVMALLYEIAPLLVRSAHNMKHGTFRCNWDRFQSSNEAKIEDIMG